MPVLKIDSERILGNLTKLNRLLADNNIRWTLITKVLGGHSPTLERILHHPVMEGIHSIGDSRITSLKTIKSIRPDVVTMYIKPPEQRQVANVIRYADISLNTYYKTIKALNEEAGRQGKIHKVIIMVELGELREGILRDHIINFYEQVFRFEHIEVIGLGTNLGCMYGIEPTFDKLIQLCLFQKIIEARFDHKLELISGGSSINLPSITKRKIPPDVNHLRIGEAAFLGTSPYNNKRFRSLSTNAFEFSGEIIELYRKESSPDGVISDASIGHTAPIEDAGSETDKTYRAVLDFGIVDVNTEDLTPKDRKVQFVGTTSDMSVYALGDDQHATRYHVGDQLKFRPNYMAVARLMHSRYVRKDVV